jgi:ribonuclease HI
VYARSDAAGLLVESGGKVEIRYKANDGKKYDALAKNLVVVDGTPLPDETCGDAVRPEPKAATTGAKAKVGPKSGAAAKAAKAAANPVPETVDGDLVAYADGACTGNPGPAGLGVVILLEKGRTELSEYLGHGTNNIAELTAILRALELTDGADGRLVVHTDSQYAIGVLSKGWKAKANTELIVRVKAALAGRRGTKLVYVPGHAGVPLNERADELARLAVQTRQTTRNQV